MEINEMNLTQIEERLGKIDEEVKTASSEVIAERTLEMESLQERQKELTAYAERKATAKDINNGTLELTPLERGTNMEPEVKTFGVETAEYREAFFKSLQGKELSVEERTAVVGTSAIPTSTMDKIYEKIEMISSVLQDVTLSKIPGNVTIPVESVDADAAWVAMGTAATDSADELGTVSLGAYKLIKTIEIGADLEAMSIPAFESYIIASLSKKLNKAMENAVFNGTGSAQPTGLLKAGVISTNTATWTKAGMTYADLLSIVAALPSGAAENAKFYMNRKMFYSEVLGIVDTTGAPVVMADPQNMARFLIAGYPVGISDRIADDKILFGDFSYYQMNIAKNAEIKADTSVGFRTGSTVYRAMELADGKVIAEDAFLLATRALS